VPGWIPDAPMFRQRFRRLFWAGGGRGRFRRRYSVETADDLVFRLPFNEAPCHVVAGGLVAAQAYHEDDVQGAVGVAVAAAVESASDGFAAGGFQRADPAEFGEGRLAADPVGVVADRGHQGGGGVGTDTVEGAQLWCGGGGDGVDVVFEPVGFGVKLAAAGGQRLDRNGDGIGWGRWDFGFRQLFTRLEGSVSTAWPPLRASPGSPSIFATRAPPCSSRWECRRRPCSGSCGTVRSR
jgi:hypothetical protein